MEKNFEKSRIVFAMDTLSLSAAELSRACGVDASTINKWRKGTRALTARSQAAADVAAALARLDHSGALSEYYAPYRNEGMGDADALAAWLAGSAIPGMAGRVAPVLHPSSGEYKVEHTVYLGKKGFRKGALAMLDYLMIVPPGQMLTVLCQGRWEWFIRDIPFTLLFLAKLKRAVERGTRMRMINRKGYSMADSSKFAGYWLIAHLKGYIRSLYYEGEMPDDIRFIGSIPGYWSGRAEEDDAVEDSLYAVMYTDPRETRRDAAVCEEYAARSKSYSQYAFFASPTGDRDNPPLWREGSLPQWEMEGAKPPDGSFNAICRVPGIALMTLEEMRAVAGKDGMPPMPAYFILGDGFAATPHKIILCREDVREGMQKDRRMHEVMSAVLRRRAFVPNEMLAAPLRRLLTAMEERKDFEVALMPRIAFAKLQLELVCFKDSVTAGWLQDLSESVFCSDEAVAGSIYRYVDVVWEKLHKGWKRRRNVTATLRKWLAGKELDVEEKDSGIVRNWDVLPRE
jgi:hypothetical protein